MKIKPLQTNEEIKLAASWLSKKENYQWLDFGNGVQKVEASTLKLMTQKKSHSLWLYTGDESDEPIGLVGMSDINPVFKTTIGWCMLGNKMAARKDYTRRACGKLIRIAFEEMNFNSIFAWTLENNVGGRRVLEGNNFRFIGRFRKCHIIDGKPYDRLLYDLTKSDYLMEKSNHERTTEKRTAGTV